MKSLSRALVRRSRHPQAALTSALFLSAFGLGFAATPVLADDPRLVERFYDPGEVYRIYGRPKVQTTITFGEGEKIENVAIGDSNAWQVTPNKRANLLFVKPLAAKAATNMTVVTNKRTYLFDLVSSTKARPVYVLSFTYPPEPDPPAPAEPSPAELALRPNATELAAANDPLAIVDPAQLNFAWRCKGDKNLLPARIFDDGNATFLAWPADVALPAILVANEKGDEGPVNFTVRGDMVIVDGVPARIVLRMGKDKAELLNEGPPRAAASMAAGELATIRELAQPQSLAATMPPGEAGISQSSHSQSSKGGN